MIEQGVEIRVMFLAEPDDVDQIRDDIHDAIERVLCPNVDDFEHDCRLQFMSMGPITDKGWDGDGN